MKTLITEVGAYLTGDAIADAVLEYWLELTREHRADILDVPIVTVDGEHSHVRLAVGWMTALAVVDTRYAPEFHDADAVAELHHRASALTPGGDGIFSPDEAPDRSVSEHYSTAPAL